MARRGARQPERERHHARQGLAPALTLVPGFMVFERSERSTRTHPTDRRGDARPTAVGWPRRR